MRAKPFTEPTFTFEEAYRVIASLEASQEHDLAHKVRRSLEIDRRACAAFEAAREAEEALRRDRAKNHVLTKRQAECLVAIREGKGLRTRPQVWRRDDGQIHARWQYVSTMGGAIHRMVETLVEEGMITERGHQLTDAGRERLAAWEAKNGPIIPEGAVVK